MLTVIILMFNACAIQALRSVMMPDLAALIEADQHAEGVIKTATSEVSKC